MAQNALKRPGSKAFYPASTTHSQLDPDEQRTTGVTGDCVRLAPGTEDFEDSRSGIEQALAKA